MCCRPFVAIASHEVVHARRNGGLYNMGFLSPIRSILDRCHTMLPPTACLMYPRNERRYVRRLGDHCQTRKIGLNASCHSKPAPSARSQALEVYSIDGLFWIFCIRFGGC